MDQATPYMALISGQREGELATLGRAALSLLALGYGGLIAVRNAWYDYLAAPNRLDVPVISVGNLTVGGTGKTPMVLWLCRELLERNRKPGVLSRGYKASEQGLADELLLIARRCPAAVAVANPDRVRAGQLAVQEYGVQAVVLDDGFQHRRLERDLDIVMVDVTRPFGYGRLLPRGLLREPVRSLRRADVVVLTRCDQGDENAVRETTETIRKVDNELPLVRSVHRPSGFVDLRGEKVAPPTDVRVGCFAGIGRPEAFARTLTQIYLTPTDLRWWPDHHVYTNEDAQQIRSWVREARIEYLVTTEKDAVKLSGLGIEWPVPIAALRVRLELLDDGNAILGNMLDAALRPYEEADEPQADQADQGSQANQAE